MTVAVVVAVLVAGAVLLGLPARRTPGPAWGALTPVREEAHARERGGGPREGPGSVADVSGPLASVSHVGLGPESATLRTRAAVSVGAVLAILMVVPGGLAVPAAVVGGAFAWHRSGALEPAARRRARARLRSELGPLVDLVLAAVAAGLPPEVALARAAALSDPLVSQTLGPVLGRLRLGAEPSAVWGDLAQDQTWGRLGLVLERSATSGAPVVEALTRLSKDLREEQRAEIEQRVRQVEVKAAAPLGACLLPSFVLLGVVPLVAGSVSGLVLR